MILPIKRNGVSYMGAVLAVSAVIALALLIYLFYVLFRGESL
ncbi:MAG: potassium-transporting ATPase subunit F [Bacillota bacterium]|nr:potassium-transporting ATPase subunit F [Bacillota bacterium]